MPEGPISSAEDRSVGGYYSRTPEDKLFGRLSRLPLNHFGPRGSGENFFYYARGKLPLHNDAFQAKECEGYVSTNGHSHVQGFDR